MASSITTPTPIQSIASPVVASQFYETPYIYSKMYVQAYVDPSPPTIPDGPYIDVIKSDGDSDFFARYAALSLNFKDMNNIEFLSSVQQNVNPGTLFAPLAPEKLFTLGSDIQIALQTSGGLISPSIAFLSYLGATNTRVNIACPLFQGVKRMNGAPFNTPSYPFYEKPWTYVIQFTQNWTFLLAPFTTLNQAPPRTFIKTVLNWDFELQCLEFSSDFFNNNSGQQIPGYMVKLYDANGYALMKDFVHYRNLSYNGGFGGVNRPNTPGGMFPWTPNCFPCPPVIYPKGSNIRVDVLSLNDTTNNPASSTQYINFRGVNRMPCS